MLGYQTQSADILGELMSNFDEPIFIPVLSEMISKALVISAEENFECSQSTKKQVKNLPRFSKDVKQVYQDHKRICRDWRIAGRPCDKHNILNPISHGGGELQRPPPLSIFGIAQEP